MLKKDQNKNFYKREDKLLEKEDKKILLERLSELFEEENYWPENGKNR